jgi:hypothetical protein
MDELCFGIGLSGDATWCTGKGGPRNAVAEEGMAEKCMALGQARSVERRIGAGQNWSAVVRGGVA